MNSEENVPLRRIAATLLLIGIALGAIGAHLLEKKLGASFKADVWDTAVLYHLIHGLALFIIALRGRSAGKVASTAWIVGILLFSGSLYLLATTSLPVGIVTPFGGLAFMVGWIALIFRKSI